MVADQVKTDQGTKVTGDVSNHSEPLDNAQEFSQTLLGADHNHNPELSVLGNSSNAFNEPPVDQKSVNQETWRAWAVLKQHVQGPASGFSSLAIRNVQKSLSEKSGMVLLFLVFFVYFVVLVFFKSIQLFNYLFYILLIKVVYLFSINYIFGADFIIYSYFYYVRALVLVMVCRLQRRQTNLQINLIRLQRHLNLIR